MRAGRLARVVYLLLWVIAWAGVARAVESASGARRWSPAQSQAIPQQPHLRGVSLSREVNPFPVLDENGRRYDLPMLGGTDVPRPQFADIDGDGDNDLFLQPYTHALWFFENTGSARQPRYEWRTDSYQGIDIGEWFRFVDLDADGDLDLLTEEPFSYVRHYRNAGDKTTPRMEYVDSLRDGDGKAMYVDRQNLPALVDLDCDGHLDMFIGRTEGIVARYEAIAPGVPRFELQHERYEGIEIVGQIDTIGSRRHGANALAFADFDADGDKDLFWGDFFERGVLLVENVGRTCSSPSFDVEPYELPYADSLRTSGYNAPVPVDLDFDGDLDFVMGVIGGAYNPIKTSVENLYYWERVANDHLELRSTRFLYGIDAGSESTPALADIDGDGDLDLVVGNKIDPRQQNAGRLLVFRNEGSAGSPSYRLTDTLALAASYAQAPAFGDLDGDGDVDLLLGTWNQGVLFFRNEGTAREPRWVRDSSLSITPTRATNTTPALADVDGDGDLDLFIGEAAGEINYYRNDGGARAPRFVPVSEKLDGIDIGRRSAPALVDVDGDGKLDLVVGREEPGVAVFRNAGTGAQPRFEEFRNFSLPLHPMSAPVFADVNGDGVLDLVTGTAGGGLMFFRGNTAR